jgi:acyl-CoA synthetase (AMP-forming)/AMP-acid ligase II
VLLNGAEPIHPETVARFIERFGPLGLRPDATLPAYGMAESTLAVTFPKLESRLEEMKVDRVVLERSGRIKPGGDTGAYVAISVGGPVAGMSVAVTSDSGQPVSEGVVGSVRVRGPSLMDGYFRNEEATRTALSDGWLATGDLGFMDEGRLFITGRSKEIIIQGGRNVYPYDVERVAAEVRGVHCGVVAAFARRNPERGTDDLVLVAETLVRDPEERAEITRAVRGELLAALGVRVDDVRLWSAGAVPRTTSGKIRRNECARIVQSDGTL